MLLYIDLDRQHLVWLMSALVLYALYVLSFRHVSRAVACALPLFVLMPMIVTFIGVYKEFPGTNVVGILFEANLDDAFEFLDGRSVSIIEALAISLGLWGLLLVAARRVSRGTPADRPSSFARWAARGTFLALGAAILGATLPAFSSPAAIEKRGGVDAAHSVQPMPFFLHRLSNVFPVGPLVSAANFYIGERNRKIVQAEKATATFGASLTDAGAGKRVYVLVIGESSRSDRWQLGGYGKETNPLLSHEPNVVFLHDVVTPWTFTQGSVPVITSRKSGADHARFFAEKSIVSLFKEAGFRTYWISNQPKPAGIGSEIGDISSEADESSWLNIATRDYARDTTYDMAVVERLKSVLAEKPSKQFIVLHLMGSHDAYRSRYPADFNAFHPSLTDSPQTGDHDIANREIVGNTYDNTIVYTDAVLHAVIETLKASRAQAGLLYTSDHGESLFDGACDFLGHGGSAKENFTVSSLVWLSDAYIGAHPDARATLIRNARRSLSTENVFESLAGMAHIDFPSADPSRSIFSRAFETRDRWVNVGGVSVDWDQARFEGACQRPVPRRSGVPHVADLARD